MQLLGGLLLLLLLLGGLLQLLGGLLLLLLGGLLQLLGGLLLLLLLLPGDHEYEPQLVGVALASQWLAGPAFTPLASSFEQQWMPWVAAVLFSTVCQLPNFPKYTGRQISKGRQHDYFPLFPFTRRDSLRRQHSG